jgi:hypothetical protein
VAGGVVVGTEELGELLGVVVAKVTGEDDGVV